MGWWIALGALVALLLVLLIRTLCFTPKPTPTTSRDPVVFDRNRAVANLQALVRCKTVSYADASQEDAAEFEKLIGLLPKLYPNVFA